MSSSTLAALREFQQEESNRVAQFAKLQSEALSRFDELSQDSDSDEDFQMDVFKEDWNLSQFWYDDATATTLANALLENVDEHQQVRIALVSAPTVYHRLRKLTKARKNVQLYLLEHDDRFRVFGKEYIFYDFNSPLHNLADPLSSQEDVKSLKGTIDRILVDPPFLSEECHTKTALTARWLLHQDSPLRRLVVCTGKKVEPILPKIYPGIKCTTFRPGHRGGLSNEFRCYSAEESELWQFEE